MAIALRDLHLHLLVLVHDLAEQPLWLEPLTKHQINIALNTTATLIDISNLIRTRTCQRTSRLPARKHPDTSSTTIVSPREIKHSICLLHTYLQSRELGFDSSIIRWRLSQVHIHNSLHIFALTPTTIHEATATAGSHLRAPFPLASTS